ncbi:MAG: protein kinase family protein [Deltaproteobacteria bacterium]|nr:MAG: protein kinase family protein [Deltaproteobacteria bacterium]
MVRVKLPGATPTRRIAAWLSHPVDESSGTPTDQQRRQRTQARLLLDLHLRNQIGRGNAGSVWTAQDARGRWLVVKEVAIASAKQEAGFLREVHMQRVFQAAGIGVPLRAAWMANTTGTAGVIVMEPVDTTLRHLVHTFQTDAAVLAFLANKLRRLVDTLHDRGLVHGDLHLDNVGVRLDASRRKVDLVLLDFERSFRMCDCPRNLRRDAEDADTFWVWRFVRLHCACFERALHDAGLPGPGGMFEGRVREREDHFQWVQHKCTDHATSQPVRVKKA